MKISFITTIFNEEKTIEAFLDSLVSQTKFPDEVVIVDGGSTDDTIARIKNYNTKFKAKNTEFTVLVKKGNRSIGRNEAIKNTTGDIIICSDAGNILDKDWVKKITGPFKNKDIDVVAGYYKGMARNVFQKCIIPYALVMPDRVNPDNFLPATRSVAFTKSIWEKVGQFNERLSHNEDYAFAKKLQKDNARIVFEKDAIVYWIPRNTVKEAFVMFFRFAYGDAEAGLWRPKVLLLFIRYLVVLTLIILFSVVHSSTLLILIVLLFFLYILWAVEKNYRYVRDIHAFYLLPLLQFIADFAVITGTTSAFLRHFIKG